MIPTVEWLTLEEKNRAKGFECKWLFEKAQAECKRLMQVNAKFNATMEASQISNGKEFLKLFSISISHSYNIMMEYTLLCILQPSLM